MNTAPIMTPDNTTDIEKLVAKIQGFGKESIEDILHLMAHSVNLLTGHNRLRIYLEDFTQGSLSCVIATGPLTGELQRMSFPINTLDFVTSRVYVNQEEIKQSDTSTLHNPKEINFIQRFNINATYVLPLLYKNRSIGALCVDSTRKGRIPHELQQLKLKKFLAQVVPTLDIARKYHQQLLLARRIDERKNREAAQHMMKSAVRLVKNLTLASVLIPAPLGSEGDAQGLRILVSYSRVANARKLYEDKQMISLQKGESLLSRYIANDGTITDERFLSPLYVPNLQAESLQKRYLTEELGLKSLYAVPRYDPHSKRIICVVNYYTDKSYDFNAFERGLLDSHAEMAERVIREIGGEHMEIRVLSEINDLLQEHFKGLQPFLNRVLSKATELIGANTGSIALVQEREDGRWLVVEDEDGNLIGAKSKEWYKKYIPPNLIGGLELPRPQRSLTGYTAHTGLPQVIANTEEHDPDGFYRHLTEAIKSELAVPVIVDNKVVATICLDSIKPHYFTSEHKRILRIIERMIGRYLVDLQQIAALTHEVSQLRRDVTYKDPKISSYKLGNIIGNSAKSTAVVNFIQTVTPPVFNRLASWSYHTNEDTALGLPSIFITGATGSGKEFVFNNLYSRLNEMYQAQFKNGRQLPIKKSNIAAYSGELTYAELFGNKRGAFTGAYADRKGILEEANGGVVFLDEIGDADPKTQVQLLRFLDNGSFVRLGENKTRFSHVLLVAATNKNLPELIRKGVFREDLFHRLSELTLEIPSLNERREDIPDLSTHFIGKLHRAYKNPEEKDTDPPVLDTAARQMLQNHHYTGNMRELRSVLLRALFFRRGECISSDDIRRAIGTSIGAQTAMLDDTDAQEKIHAELAQRVFTSIVNDVEDFWSALYTPYTNNNLPRAAVIACIELARSQGATTMPAIAKMLKACDPNDVSTSERKTFFRFKNFLYKTIRIA